ncbi:MAG: hypothetical protein ONB13_05195 [candidate division KSB1 bacterium]|nr:hypothetical protein [candidate division KSB1 bacterium]MDZ7333538.1 hypothetical protein [candidate division KSB1 bacterium]MDZ7358196.1 hypothetical protein [candidate division KSB1 bacterium]MDZ7375997.1 hypothetical protein [candidate division KSB1 bacterium]MDZ7398652.1 hypothetical protein [candidate division KSB1 bacterium]
MRNNFIFLRPPTGRRIRSDQHKNFDLAEVYKSAFAAYDPINWKMTAIYS